MIQLYILFMITPLFFTLAQVDRHAIEAARDLGANWWRTFREVILPQTMPGIVIGSIFIFVLTMGDYGTVATVGGGNITSVGTLIYSKIGAVQYPQGAASAVLLVIVADGRRLGDHALLEPAGGPVIETMARRPRRSRAAGRVVQREVKQRRDWAKWGLGVYFALFLFFLYVPMILMAILSFQGDTGQLTFPFRGPVQPRLVEDAVGHGRFDTIADDVSASARQSLWLSLAAGAIVAVLALFAVDGVPPPLAVQDRRPRLLRPDAGADDAGLPLGLGNQLLWRFMGETPSLWYTALGANVIWGIPFGFLVMLAVWNRYDRAHRGGGARPRREPVAHVPRGDAAARLDRACSAASCSASR